MQIRRGTATAWATADPTLVAGELGFVTDAGKTAFKIGDGTNPWTTLPYVNSTYTELPVDAGNNLDTAIVQGRYPLLTGVTYTSVPADFTGGTTTQGNSLLLVTVPTNTIVIQELTTSLTPCKRWIRARGASVWTAWKRIDTLSATESLSITNLTLSGALTATGQITTLGSMGVGTASPQQRLDVNGNITSNRTATGSFVVSGDGIYTFGTDVKQYIYGTSGNAGTIGLYASNAGGTSAQVLYVTSTGAAVTGSFNAIGINAAASGLTSSGGLTVSSGTTSLTVPLVLGTAAAVGTTVFSTKTTSAAGGAVVTTIRGDGVPTATTDLTTKTYVDTAVAAVTYREMMIVSCVGTVDSNFSGSNIITTGFTSATTSIVLATSSAFTVTSVSNVPGSTITWTAPIISNKRRLAVSAGTWTILAKSGGPALTDGAVFHCIRTA